MSLSVYEQFLHHFQRGVLKPNRYRVLFTLPEGVQATAEVGLKIKQASVSGNILGSNMSLNENGGIDIKCHTATFPQRTLQTYEINQNTSPYRVPFSQMYDPVTFSFYADSTADTRRFFDIWQNAVVNVKSNTLNFYTEFVRNVTIWSLDDAGNETYGVVLRDAYPLSVGAMEVSYSQANNFQTTVVTMAYRNWEDTTPTVTVGSPETIR